MARFLFDLGARIFDDERSSDLSQQETQAFLSMTAEVMRTISGR
jgi:hypothetical protein